MLTYLRRYGVVAILGIAPEEDDDGQSAQRGAEDTKKTPAQNRKIFGLIGDLDKLHAKPPAPHPDWKVATEARCHELFGHGISALTKDEAGTLIDAMAIHVKAIIENQPSSFQAPEGTERLVPDEDSTPF